MKQSTWMFAALVLVACAHTRKAEDANDAQASQPGEVEAQAEVPEQQQQTTPGTHGLVAGGAKDPDEIPVSTSAQGLLKPGAEKKVRDKLGMKGTGGSLHDALQKFQRSHDMPATGMLDHQTAKELGLDPDDIFERARGQ